MHITNVDALISIQGNKRTLRRDANCQVSRFRQETPVFVRPLRPVVWPDLSPVFTFTYGMSGGESYTRAGEATVLLLDCQAHHCLLIYAVLEQTGDARDVSRL